MSWARISQKKQVSLKALIPSEWRLPADKQLPETQADVSGFVTQSGWFTPREIEIMETDTGTILEYLRGGKWSSVEVTRVFCKVAAAAQELVRSMSSIAVEIELADECVRQTV